MRLFDLFKSSPQQKLREHIYKKFDEMVKTNRRIDKMTGIINIFQSSDVKYYNLLTFIYENMKKDESMRILYNVSDTEYYKILDDVYNCQGRIYVKNWESILINPKERIQRENEKQIDSILSKL